MPYDYPYPLPDIPPGLSSKDSRWASDPETPSDLLEPSEQTKDKGYTQNTRAPRREESNWWRNAVGEKSSVSLEAIEALLGIQKGAYYLSATLISESKPIQGGRAGFLEVDVVLVDTEGVPVDVSTIPGWGDAGSGAEDSPFAVECEIAHNTYSTHPVVTLDVDGGDGGRKPYLEGVHAEFRGVGVDNPYGYTMTFPRSIEVQQTHVVDVSVDFETPKTFIKRDTTPVTRGMVRFQKTPATVVDNNLTNSLGYEVARAVILLTIPTWYSPADGSNTFSDDEVATIKSEASDNTYMVALSPTSIDTDLSGDPIVFNTSLVSGALGSVGAVFEGWWLTMSLKSVPVSYASNEVELSAEGDSVSTAPGPLGVSTKDLVVRLSGSLSEMALDTNFNSSNFPTT